VEPQRHGAAPSSQAGTQTIVYVACAASNEILVLNLERSTGRLEPVQRIAVPAGITPLALGPQQRSLYAGLRGEPPSILTFAIDPFDGRLELAAAAPLPVPPMYLAVSTDGNYLLSASYDAAAFAINAVRGDGGIEGEPVQRTATPPHAHAILTDKTSRFLFVTALGGDAILQYTFDASTGRALPNAVPFVAAPRGSGPRHVVLHPRADVVYVNGELDGSICSYALDPTSGELRALMCARMLPETSEAKPWAAELAIDPAARYLYASDRRTSTLCTFDLRGEPGTLRRCATIDTEEQPRSFAIDPRGEFLVLAGEKSNAVIVYAIEPSSGALAARGRHAVGEKPVWVAIAEPCAEPCRQNGG
jgi:6-phosphogluconolactonase